MGVITVILLEDTRQQARKHEAKHRWFAENGIEVGGGGLYPAYRPERLY